MAISTSLSFSLTLSTVPHKIIPKSNNLPYGFASRRTSRNNTVLHAIEKKGRDTDSETLINLDPITVEKSQSEETKDVAETSKLGLDINKGLDGSRNLWGGVAEEIGEIEWPPFGKVLGTTGVVLGVIAGSSIVLLTVNAILAEISDRVFVGKGIQDFFG